MSEFYEEAACKEVCPAGLYDVAAVETWLEDMAREGWRLTGFRGFFGCFEKDAPGACRYRLQPMARKKEVLGPEREAVYRELGWTPAAKLGGAFWVWRCDDPSAPELDTDPVVQGEGYRYLKRRMVRSTVANLLWAAAFAALLVWSLGTSDTPLLEMVRDETPGKWLLWVLAIPLGLFLLAQDWRAMGRLLRTLKAGVPLVRPRPYRLQKRLSGIACALLVGIWALSFFGGGRAIDGGSLGRGWSAYGRDGGLKPGVVFVDLRALEDAAGEVEFMGCRTKVHELAPRMYFVEQYAKQPDGSLCAAETEYYRMLTPRLARRLAAEMTQARPGVLGRSPQKALKEIPSLELDEFWWCRMDTGEQCAAAVLGRQVIYVQYQGTADLREEGAVFAEVLRGNAD